MRTLILILLCLFILSSHCLAQKNYVVSPEVHQSIQPFVYEIRDFVSTIPNINNAEFNIFIKDLKSALIYFSAALFDIYCMIDIESSHYPETNKKSIFIIQTVIQQRLDEVEKAITSFSKPVSSQDVTAYAKQTIGYLKQVKLLLIRIKEELPS